ncbi:adaptin ear-binding coat-associated protein 2 [Purpureocillium lavendulum]|uniref:Adaptin ear-binding coat-associated protein 2 n=1 Tax=Purpureocillium lavendulum TaxID=1247861 RepID=A0AB34G040_9HYPO|nr:adaptin ear-binding coat-associated protein 2 [Purpureocillium lavendulum]
MDLVDPATGRPLPSDAIQRVLFVANAVHVYNIPPLTSMRGHSATAWTADPSRHIFTARLRVIETSTSEPLSSSSSSSTSSPAAAAQASSSSQHIKVDLVLEDTSSPSTPQLFAAAPYTHPSAVEPVVDSSRFFAITVRDDQGRKAVLGIGFEERSDAFDMAVALQEARRGLGLDSDAQRGGQRGAGADAAGEGVAGKDKATVKDYSLKEGETITVNLGSKFGRRRPEQHEQQETAAASLQSFALAPPPSSSASSAGEAAGGFALPPPPTAEDVKRKRRSLRDLGFDDGQFGEFA